MPGESFNVGGQAVIEGVMMKAPRRVCVAVRQADGGMVVKNQPFRPLSARYPLLAKPFLRGPVVLGETLVLGLKALSFSAQQAMEEEGEDMGSLALGLTMLLAVAAGVGVFVVLPHLLAFWLGQWDVLAYGVESLTFHLVDGVVKVALFVGYIYLISLMKEIKRVFMYHGAEHKSIYCSRRRGTHRGHARRHSRLPCAAPPSSWWCCWPPFSSSPGSFPCCPA